VNNNVEKTEVIKKQERIVIKQLKILQNLLNHSSTNSYYTKKRKFPTPKSQSPYWIKGKSKNRSVKPLPKLIVKAFDVPHRYKSRIELPKFNDTNHVESKLPEVKKKNLYDCSMQNIFFRVTTLGKTQKLSDSTLLHSYPKTKEPIFKEAEFADLKRINGRLNKLKDLIRTRLPEPKFNIIIKQIKDN